MLKVKFRFGKSDANYDGTQPKGKPWNQQTVHGWKLCCVDLLPPIKRREESNPEGGRTRARWYKRFILYFPSGAWRHFDVAIVSKWAERNPANESV